MTTLDQFESVFKSADKAVYAYQSPTFDRVLLVTALDDADTAAITTQIRSFLAEIDETRRHWPFLRDRRIDAYGELTKRVID